MAGYLVVAAAAEPSQRAWQPRPPLSRPGKTADQSSFSYDDGDDDYYYDEDDLDEDDGATVYDYSSLLEEVDDDDQPSLPSLFRTDHFDHTELYSEEEEDEEERILSALMEGGSTATTTTTTAEEEEEDKAYWSASSASSLSSFGATSRRHHPPKPRREPMLLHSRWPRLRPQRLAYDDGNRRFLPPRRHRRRLHRKCSRDKRHNDVGGGGGRRRQQEPTQPDCAASIAGNATTGATLSTATTTTNLVQIPGDYAFQHPSAAAKPTTTKKEEKKQQQQAKDKSHADPLPSVTATAPNGSKRVAPSAPPSSSSATTATSPWVKRFLSCHAKQAEQQLMLVPLDFFLDPFNLAQLAPVVEHVVYSAQQQQQQQPAGVKDHSLMQNNNNTASFPLYRQALQRITSTTLQEEQEKNSAATAGDDDAAVVDMAAVVLYCLVHQRYVLSPRGLEALRRRFLLRQSAATTVKATSYAGDTTTVNPMFGRCPNPDCHGMPLLPAGQDEYNEYNVMTMTPTSSNTHHHHEPTTTTATPLCRYCGHCQKYWMLWDKADDSGDAESAAAAATPPPMEQRRLGRFVQGCAWGVSLGPLFHLSYPGFLQPLTPHRLSPPPPQEPRIFGFRIHPSAHRPSALQP